MPTHEPPILATAARATPAERPSLVRHWKILAIVLLAGLLRFNHFRQPLTDVFSWRQTSTAMMAWNFYHESWNIFFPAVNWNGPDPAYTGREFQTVTFLAALLYNIFGPDDWIGRAISATFGVWGVFAMYALVRRVWDERRALCSALMLAILPGAVFIDRSFLPDPAMLALTITTVWLYVAYLQTQQRRYLTATALVGVLAFLTKLPGIIALAPMIYATVSILRQRRQLDWPHLRPIVLALIGSLIPIAAYYWWAVYLGTHYPPYHVAGASNWVWVHGFRKWLDKGYYVRETWENFYFWLWTPVICALAALGFLLWPDWAEWDKSADDAHETDARSSPGAPWLFHFWLGGCLVLYLVGARELQENVWNLHVFNVVGAAMAGQALVWIAFGLRSGTAGASQWRGPALRIAAVVGLVLVWSHDLHLPAAITRFTGRPVLTTLYQPAHALDGYRLGRALERQTKEGDTVVVIADDVGDPVPIYYSRRRGWVFPPAHRQDVWKPWNLMPPDDRLSIAMFEDLRADGADWLGIVNNPKDDTPGRREFWKNHPTFIEHINRTCQLITKTPFYVIYRIRTPEELRQMGAAASAPASQPR